MLNIARSVGPQLMLHGCFGEEPDRRPNTAMGRSCCQSSASRSPAIRWRLLSRHRHRRIPDQCSKFAPARPEGRRDNAAFRMLRPQLHEDAWEERAEVSVAEQQVSNVKGCDGNALLRDFHRSLRLERRPHVDSNRVASSGALTITPHSS